ILSTRRCDVSAFTTGHIINLVSNDAQKMEDSVQGFIFALTTPVELTVSVALLWCFIGWQSLSGVLYFVVLLIYNFVVSKKFAMLRAKVAAATDKRLAIINNIICGIRAVKMYAWEWSFRDLVKRLRRYQDEHTKSFSLVKSSESFLGLYLDLLSVSFLTCVAVGALVVTQDSAMTGLLITYAIELVGETWYGILSYSQTENYMTSAERVITYTKLPSEPAYSRTSLPPPDWPDKGAIKIQDMSLAYLKGGKLVLKDINFEVMAKQKVGIVGRTGAGKSSLVAALFRMPDPQGKVLIDGVDLGKIDIQTARRSMAVITQDPVLFASSLRKNLDPFEKFSDEQIWTVLEEVQLKNTIQNTK
ncbi:hypothetical protein QZH41_015838, partial [Actinostola sp. cb2023]